MAVVLVVNLDGRLLGWRIKAANFRGCKSTFVCQVCSSKRVLWKKCFDEEINDWVYDHIKSTNASYWSRSETKKSEILRLTPQVSKLRYPKLFTILSSSDHQFFKFIGYPQEPKTLVNRSIYFSLLNWSESIEVVQSKKHNFSISCIYRKDLPRHCRNSCSIYCIGRKCRMAFQITVQSYDNVM